MKYWPYLKRYGGSLLHWCRNGVPLLLLLALIFALVAIWWLGPQWTWRGKQPLADLSVRVVLTILLLVLPIVAWAFVLQRRNRKLEAEQQRAQSFRKDPALRFVHAQERALDRLLTVLRANLPKRQGLYRLPWYLVLGQQRAGKTSLINRSGQNFSLTGEIKAGHHLFDDPDLAYRIDWWMGDEAILIDPPGELVSQPPEKEYDLVVADAPPQDDGTTATEAATVKADSAPSPAMQDGKLPRDTHAHLWENLIDWLGRNRSRRPLNGVVLVVDLPTLLGQKTSDRKALATLLRTRLAELSRRLGTRPPLYVVLSKFDLLDGFEPFFARLTRSAREDIFGFTFTLDSVQNYDAWLGELAARYDGFVQGLNDQIFDALAQAADIGSREALFSLVNQVAGMRSILLGFLADVLGSDRYVTPALPRGVYFSSVHQQGVLTNAFVTHASENYQLEVPAQGAQPPGRSTVYFAQHLFQRVIYPEAGLAGDNLKVLADKKRTLAIGFGVAALGTLVLAGAWYHYYDVNRTKLVSVLDKSRAFSQSIIDSQVDTTGQNLLVPLNQLRDAVAVYGDYREAWPVVADLGLYQGRKIGPKVDQAYLNLLSTRFLPELAAGVVNAMDTAPNDGDAQLAALRVYRMLEDRGNRQVPIVEDWMTHTWQKAFPADAGVQHDLRRHLDYAMKYADTNLPQYRARVAVVQQQLRQIPLPQRVYMTMRAQAGEAMRTPLDLRNEIGPAYDVVYQTPTASGGSPTTSPRIDALLTARGYRGYFETHEKDLTTLAMIDQWALGERRNISYSEADKRALAERISALYSRDYIDAWRRGINQLDVRDFNDINQAVTVLTAVTSPAAPLRRLVETVRDNTNLPPATESAAGNSEGKPAPTAPAAAQSMNGVTQAFTPLTDLLLAKDNKPAYLDETTVAIGNVQDVVKRVQDSQDRSKAALDAVLDRFALKGPDPIGNLQRIAAGLPAPLDTQVKKLADESSQVLIVEALKELEKRWDADVYSFYRQRLAGRYPFNPGSKEDVSLDDFTAFFGPQGKLQQFKEQYLKVFLEDNLEALYSQRLGGYLVRTDVLEQLKAADQIRDTFFNSRGALGVQFTVEPLGLSPTRRSSVLSLQGQLLNYTHGPTESIGMIWPNTLGGTNESSIMLVNSTGNSSSLVFRGGWSVFRLLSQARLNGATASSVDLSFIASDGGMRYRFTAEKANNPFTQQVFSGFALPRTLLQTQSSARPSPKNPRTVASAPIALDQGETLMR